MARTTVEIDTRELDRLIGTLESRTDAIVQQAALVCESEAKNLCPVDTGFLKGSITARRTGPAQAEVVAGAEYAAVVEYGSSRMAARPYMTPAALKAAEYVQAQVAEVFHGR